MLKTIGKIVYLAFAAILAVLFGILNYNTSSDEEYVNLVTTAAKDEDTEKLVYAFSSFGLPYDAVPYKKTSVGSNNKYSVYGSLNQISMTYYTTKDQTNTTETFKRIEFIYYIFLRDPSFKYSKYTDNGTVMNNTGIRFYNEDGASFDYHFVISDTINKDEYIEHPMTRYEALMNTSRNYTVTYMNERYNYHFMLTPVSESMVEYITTNKLNNKPITKMNYIDSEGKLVYENDIDIRLDFSQDFFSADKGIMTYRDAFRKYYDSDTNTEEGKKAKEEATKYINEFKIESLNNANYKLGLKKEEIYHAGLVWKTIGLVFVFVLAFAIVYFLLFHFALIKRLVFRRSSGRTTRYVPNKIDKKDMYKPKNSAIKAEVREVKPEENAEAEQSSDNKENN